MQNTRIYMHNITPLYGCNNVPNNDLTFATIKYIFILLFPVIHIHIVLLHVAMCYTEVQRQTKNQATNYTDYYRWLPVIKPLVKHM